MEDKRKELPTTRMIDKISEGAELMRNIIIRAFKTYKLENYSSMGSEKPIKDDFFYLNLAVKHILLIMKTEFGNNNYTCFNKISNIVYISDHVVYQLENGDVCVNSVHVRDSMFDVFFKAGMATPINECKEELMGDTELIAYGYKFLTNWRGIAPIWKLIKYNDYIGVLRPDNTIRINTQTIKYIPFDEFRCNRNFDKDPIDDIVEKIEEIEYKYLFKSGESAGKEMLWKKSQSKGTPMVIHELLDEM